MSGRRLLDAAIVFTAVRRVASKHVALRANQLDVYSKTSTLAKAVQSQSERVTLTVKAATALVAKFNETGPQYSTEASQEEPPAKSPTSSGQDSSEGLNRGQKQGLEQDHFYEKSSASSTAESPPKESLEIQQEKTKRAPLPDGSIPSIGAEQDVSRQDEEPFFEVSKTDPVNVLEEQQQTPEESLEPNYSQKPSISQSTPPQDAQSANKSKKLQRQPASQIPSRAAEPPPESALSPEGAAANGNKSNLNVTQEQESFHEPSSSSDPVFSSLSKANIPRNTEDAQESEKLVPDDQINQDVFYTPGSRNAQQAVPGTQAVPEQEQLSEQAYSEIFHSPKVARILGGQPTGSKPSKGLDLPGAKETPVKDTKAPQETDQVSSGERTPMQDSAQSVSAQDPELAKVSGVSDDVHSLAADISKDADHFHEGSPEASEALGNGPPKAPYEMRESRVPSSRFGRIWQYGGLAASMTMGAVGESFRRATGGSGDATGGSLMLSAGNMERLVAKLSRMRGAALKLGQMMSFQDSKMPPGPINEVLQRVQDSADYMPASQRDKVLASNLGADWRDLFSSFDEKPMAAASIGQVHSAVLESSGQQVAIKVQYPGVANSIDSDLSNLSVLLNASRLLPKGLYLDKTIANARTELAWECDYIREAEMGRRFRDLLADEPTTFHVPAIIKEASGPQVLTAEFCPGIGVTKAQNFTQDQKDWIGSNILRLCLREITEFKLMQTDPNWTNFLFNSTTRKLELLDFGASRDFPDKFITPYIRTLLAASRSDRATVRDLSIQLGYLTGHESKAMLNAHVDSVLTLAEPFMETAPAVYDFRDQTITERVRGLIPVMVRERLAPPPEETYSLHRKLSGAFLLCARLGSRVRCREMFANAMAKAGVA